jgi:hypothetical protein
LNYYFSLILLYLILNSWFIIQLFLFLLTLFRPSSVWNIMKKKMKAIMNIIFVLKFGDNLSVNQRNSCFFISFIYFLFLQLFHFVKSNVMSFFHFPFGSYSIFEIEKVHISFWVFIRFRFFYLTSFGSSLKSFPYLNYTFQLYLIHTYNQNQFSNLQFLLFVSSFHKKKFKKSKITIVLLV